MCRHTGWFKSSYSGSGDDNCVEVRMLDGTIGVRDSKDPAGGAFWVDTRAWGEFLTGIRSGQNAPA